MTERTTLSRDARVVMGVSLILVPTIVFGGATLLGIITGGAFGAPGPSDLSPAQIAFYRAGHAHAGVLLILSLVLQIALDHVRLGTRAVWSGRITAVGAALLVSGGFFGIAHLAGLRFVLYAGVLSLVYATLLTGVGLIRRSP